MNERAKRLILKIGKFSIIPLFLLLLFCLYRYTNLFVLKVLTVVPLNSQNFQNISETQISSLPYFSSDRRYFEINVASIKSDILNSSTFVKSVYVSKELPDQLLIYIQERTPFISLEISQKRCILLDNEGLVLEMSDGKCDESAIKYSTIKVVSDDPKVTFSLGSQSNYFQIKKIANLVKVMNQYQVPVVSINISENIVTVTSTKDKKYIFSFNQDLDTQLARFVAVLGQLEKKKYSYKKIDLRFKRPVLTIK